MRPLGLLPRSHRSLWVGPFVVLVLGAIVLITHLYPAWDLRALAGGAVRDPMILAAILIVYVGLIATPFVPGAEIGFFLLALFGASMAIPLYLATVAALTLSFLIGQAVPRVRVPDWPERLASGAAASEPLSWHEIEAGARSRWLRHLMRFRCLALILLINLPGNTLLGGGGGIAMAAGNCRAFTIWAFVVSAAVAVAPVPLAVLVADHLDAGAALGRWLQAASEASGL